MDASKYFIAVLGNKQPDVLLLETKPITIFNTMSQAVEVYKSPFDAIKALNEINKIKPEEDITIYETEILNNYIVQIQKNKDIHIFASIDLVFDKKLEMVLGNIVKYL